MVGRGNRDNIDLFGGKHVPEILLGLRLGPCYLLCRPSILLEDYRIYVTNLGDAGRRLISLQ